MPRNVALIDTLALLKRVSQHLEDVTVERDDLLATLDSGPSRGAAGAQASGECSAARAQRSKEEDAAVFAFLWSMFELQEHVEVNHDASMSIRGTPSGSAHPGGPSHCL